MRRGWVVPDHPQLSVARQCTLLGVARSSLYYTPCGLESPENERLMRMLDAQYLKTPFYGVPRMTWWLQQQGEAVNHKRVARLMRLMGLQATLPGPHTSRPGEVAVKYPYLLRKLTVLRPNQVWCADITYVPLQRGFLYLVAVMDWYSRYVLAWSLSNSMESEWCVSTLQRALEYGCPEIFNTDQGSQFTSAEFTGALQQAGIAISWDGRGRALDNAFIERLWRSVKYEHLYLHAHADGPAVHAGLTEYFRFYNHTRPHSGWDNQTPAKVHGAERWWG